MSALCTLVYANPNSSSSHRVQPSSMFAVHAWYSATFGRFSEFHPARDANEKSPLAGSRHTAPPCFHARFTDFHESVSDAFNTGPAACAGAAHSPDTDTASFTAFTSTPIS